jgi:serine/threonine protein phosphatase 1
MKKIVISDIHGCNKTFWALLEKTGFSTGDRLFLLGDYIDRGPDSKGVIDSIFRLRDEGYDVSCIRGNHEQMLIDAWDHNDWKHNSFWLYNGGQQALDSFGVAKIPLIPQKYNDFIRGLEYYIEDEEVLMVHAGLSFGTSNPLENQHPLMWIRNWYDGLDYQWLGDRYVIHGHTPTPKVRIQDMLRQLDQRRYLCIDAGCCFTREGYHSLCAFEINSKELFFQKNID